MLGLHSQPAGRCGTIPASILITCFDDTAKFLLFTILPAAFIGAVPAEFVLAFTWTMLAQLLTAAVVLLTLAVLSFQRGLRRYKGGSVVQIQM
jgi:ABC-2 type transport system permease protein